MRVFLIKMLSEAEIRKIALLARLELSEEEIAKYTKELGGILGYFEKLNEVNTDNIEPVSQITGLKNIQRKDMVKKSESAKALIDCSPNEIKNSHIVAKNVF